MKFLCAPAIASGNESLAARTIRGLQWSYAAVAAAALLQIAVTAVMSRLLAPAAYGVLAAAGLFMRFGSYFSQMGVGQALVQKPALADRDIRAAFTATASIGILVASLMCAAAPLSRHILDSAEVAAVVRWLALALALDSLASTSLNLLRRRLRFRALSIINTSAYAVSSVAVGVPLALFGADLWALAAVFVSRPAATLCLAYYCERHSLRLSWDWRTHKALLSYGTKLSLTSFAEYLFFMADVALVGQRWGAALLGVYARSGLLATLLIQNLTTAMMEVLFPAFSRAQKDNARLSAAYLQGLALLGLLSFPLAIGMIAAAADLVWILLGSQYTNAVPLVQLLVIAVPFSMTASYAATLCNVSPHTGTRLVQQLLLCALVWLAVWTAAPAGALAIAAASVSVQGLRMVLFSDLARRHLGLTWHHIAVALYPGVRLAALVGLAVHAAAWILSDSVTAARFTAEVGTAVLVWVVFWLWFPPSELLPVVLRVLNSLGKASHIRLLIWYRQRITAALLAASTPLTFADDPCRD